MTCAITKEMKDELRPLRATAIDNWVIKNQNDIFPQRFAAQRVNEKGKAQPPRMMSAKEFYAD